MQHDEHSGEDTTLTSIAKKRKAETFWLLSEVQSYYKNYKKKKTEKNIWFMGSNHQAQKIGTKQWQYHASDCKLLIW
jgi:acetylglutamate kinase